MAKFTENDIQYMVMESVKKILKESLVRYYVVDDGGAYNVLSSDMFDANGRYIENKSYTIDDFDIIKTTNNEEIAWKYADKLNREYQEQYGDFQPSDGYFNESKIRVSESKLNSLIKECLTEVINEDFLGGNQFDNISDEELSKFGENYYDVIVPEWALNALVNGDYSGLDDEDIADVKAFERNFGKGATCELYNGLTAGDFCVPMEGTSPSFYEKNDINHKGANCYRFAFIAKQDN